MPRTLPWLTGTSTKESKASTLTPRQSKKRPSSPDRLVNSDLDDVDPPKRNGGGGGKKRAHREPSSSPPPMAASEVAYMNEGLTADDIYVMVEDEFYSTAQKFTAPLHRAAYERLKRLHRSRGAETLANIERATDGRTKQSTALRMKMEAEERAKKRRSAGLVEEDESDDDDEYMAVPELAGLMTSSQGVATKKVLANVTKAKSNTRAAAGFSQSPNKGNKTKDVFAREEMSPVEEDEGMEDEDDLDIGSTKTALSYAWKDLDPTLNKPRASIEKPQEAKPKSTGFFKAFTTAAKPEPKNPADKPNKTNGASYNKAQLGISREPLSTPAANGLVRRSTGGKGSRMAEILAKRKQSTQAPEPQPNPADRTQMKDKSIKREPLPPPKADDKPLISSSDPTDDGSKSTQYLAQRKAARENREAEEKRKNTKRDDIPTFLF